MEAIKPARISWTALRGTQERKNTRSRGSGGAGKVYYPGNVVDACTRRWLDDPTSSLVSLLPDQVSETDADLADQGKRLRWSARERDTMLRNCETALVSLQPILEERVLPYEFQHGYRFETPEVDSESGSFYLVGELDILVKEGDKYRIHDIKMTSNNGYWRHTLGQLIFYSVALEYLDKEVFAASLIQPLCSPKELHADLSDQAVSSIIRAIGDYLR